MKLIAISTFASAIVASPIKPNVTVAQEELTPIETEDNWKVNIEELNNLPDDELASFIIDFATGLEVNIGLTIDELLALSDDEIETLITSVL